MKVNLKQLPAGGEPLVLEATCDLSQLRYWGEHPFRKSAPVRAVFCNKNGIVTLQYSIRFQFEGHCARCLDPVLEVRELEQFHTLVEEVANEDKQDAFIIVPDGLLELDELVLADVSLSLTQVPLCSPDCQGLCPTCGANRNQQPCSCTPEDESFRDSRFDALRELLEEDGEKA